MEIVIKIPDIPKNDHERWALKNGTPLPKMHGRLIDADWVKNTLDIYVLNEYNGQFIRRSDIDNIPTIIEADREVQDADND